MSRIAKYPIALPAGVEFDLQENQINVKGPLGSLSMQANHSVHIEKKDGGLQCSPKKGATNAHAMSGTMRALLYNMVHGVSKGFEKKLNLVGVGYRAQAQGDKLNLNLGFSHPVVYVIPEGIKVETPSQTEIIIKGTSKQQVGQIASEIRAFRPPEPYKGKGVRYADEIVVIKETKKK